MKRWLIASFLAITLLISGCSSVGSKVTEFIGNDLGRTVELAQKYGKPEVATCAAFLQAAIDGDAALAKEDTSGLISLAFKLYLLQESKPAAEEEFKKQCGAVAAGLLVQAGKTMRK